ncbi:MAG: general secretion pathway protein GspK [Candidatus Omnitrophica bacterium]|nr:general secretion pathway protein GspK [Candidatus Omnitrophota bacterium]MBU1870244.1 general secretion pathway protein GspK [Candidatus Omnitrophota bacterium]
MTKDKKGSVLIIALSILAILAIFALGLGQRAALDLRLARYQRDSLKSFELAKSGINRAIIEIANDSTNDYDSLKDNWANNETSAQEEFIYGIKDEEGKINLNKCGLGQNEVKEILIYKGLPDAEAEEIRKILSEWINSAVESEPEKAVFKNEYLRQAEEFLLILEFYYKNKGVSGYEEEARKLFDKIKDSVTVFGDGKVNINTCAESVLKSIARAAAKTKVISENYADSLISQIIETRDSASGPFKAQAEIDSFIPQKTEEQDIYDAIKPRLKIKSDFFRIEAGSHAGKTAKKIESVYDRSNNVIAYWHQG